jgi:hypothetical protein
MRGVFDWIWQIRGDLALAPGVSGSEALARLDPLFRTAGTTWRTDGDTLVFEKKDAAAQDRLSVFDRGVIRVEQGAAGAVLRYRLMSKALLACFLAPLLFLALAQANVLLGRLDHPADAADHAKDKAKPKIVLNPIDKLLGAPAPDDKKADDQDEDGKKHSPTPGYVFAGIFVALYAIGRVLEDRLVRSLFSRRLSAA